MSHRFFIFSCGWIAFGLASCGPPADPTKKSVSIGRMGIRSVAPVEAGAHATPAVSTAPTPAVTNQSSTPKPQDPPETGPVPVQPGAAGTSDNIRLPNMLTLPEKKELQPTNPSVPNSGPDGGAVIARPPAEKRD